MIGHTNKHWNKQTLFITFVIYRYYRYNNWNIFHANPRMVSNLRFTKKEKWQWSDPKVFSKKFLRVCKSEHWCSDFPSAGF